MRRLFIFGILIISLGFGNAKAQTLGSSFADSCGQLPIAEACDLVGEAAKMLEPSYKKNKRTDGIAAFKALGYDSEYFAAKSGFAQPTIDFFFASKANSNRLFIVVTGTESVRDWFENAKLTSYTANYRDGQFYVPPAHAGFRRGMLSIVNSGIFKINEFDNAPLDCGSLSPKASHLSRYLCKAKVNDGSGRPIDVVILGHSRGSAIGQVIAPIVDGYEFQDSAEGLVIARQKHWPLRIAAVIGFAPPYAIYARTDREAGIKVPQGIPSQWDFLKTSGIDRKTILFLNDRDAVPIASLEHGRHFGYRYRVTGYGAALYDGTCWGPDASSADAHKSAGYAAAILSKKEPQDSCD